MIPVFAEHALYHRLPFTLRIVRSMTPTKLSLKVLTVCVVLVPLHDPLVQRAVGVTHASGTITDKGTLWKEFYLL